MKRHALNGPTMGTRWSAVFHLPEAAEEGRATPDLERLQAALQAAVAAVDDQMSTWKADSDLARLNDAPVGVWLDLPEDLLAVITAGIAIGVASGGAFDITLGDAVVAWGFGPAKADQQQMLAARQKARVSAADSLELDPANRRLRKHQPVRLDLNGIAKGYGVDRLYETARLFGLQNGLFSIDGEVRALGAPPDTDGWTIAIEQPDRTRRAAHSLISLKDAAIATSGDYRHWVEVGGRHLSHTIDPRQGLPLRDSPASATVIAETCMAADAWATVFMVKGIEAGLALAEARQFSVLYLSHGAAEGRGTGVFAA